MAKWAPILGVKIEMGAGKGYEIISVLFSSLILSRRTVKADRSTKTEMKIPTAISGYLD